MLSDRSLRITQLGATRSRARRWALIEALLKYFPMLMGKSLS